MQTQRSESCSAQTPHSLEKPTARVSRVAPDVSVPAGNVLIADQDGTSRIHFRTTLSSHGFDVGEASSNEEIAKRLRMIDYDSVLLNVNLGIEAIHCVRAQSGIRRHHAVDVVPDRIITIGDITLDPIRRRVEKRGVLMESAGKPLTHPEIFHSLWGKDTGGNRAMLRALVRELRKKLEPTPSKPRHILTDSRVGYRFE